MKKCVKCNEEKELTEFNKANNTKDKLTGVCRVCNLKHRKEYKKANSEKLKEQDKLYRLNNSEKLKEQDKLYRLNNKEKIKEYFIINKEKRKEYHKTYALNNKEKAKQYRLNNKEKINLYYKKYRKEKKITKPLFKLRCDISSNIQQAIKRQGYTKKTKTYEILGCSFEEFKMHLERQFTEGMNWENQGQWHLDHIYPVSLAKDEDELIKLNHYTNFQPLWAFDNLSKGNKIIEKQLTLI